MITQLNEVAQVWWQWMGSMFWQVSLLIVIVTLLDMFLRKWAWPQVRYALWALVFIKLIISPAWQMPTSIVSWVQPKVEEQVSIQVTMSEDIEESSMNFIPPNNEGVVAPVVAEQVNWKSYALLAWLSGMFVFTFMLLRKMYKFRKMHRVDEKSAIPDWFNELMTKTASRLKLKKIPSVIFTGDAKSPAVYGVFRPVLMLPDGYLDKLSREQAEHVLMHELCHLKRGDLLVHWFCIVVQLIYWFNPLLIWTRRQMRHICEICCDLSVASILREKTSAYRETLLKSARELFAENLEPSLGFFGIFEEPFRLVPRLRWLEKNTWENRKMKILVTICTTLFMVACVMPMSKPSPEIKTEQSDNTNADKQLLNLEFVDADITHLIRLIHEVSGKNIIWDPAIKGKTISVTRKDIPWDEALDIILKETGLARKDVGENVIWITSREKIVAAEEADKLNRTSGMKYPKTEYKGNLLYLDFVDADVTHIIKLINEVTKENIIWDPAIKGRKISMLLKNTPWDEALDLVLKATGLAKKNVAENVILITTQEKVKQMTAAEKAGSLKKSPDIKLMKKPDKGKLLDLNFEGADITDMLMMISREANVNITWDPAIRGRKVDALQKDVPWEEALDIILKNNELAKRNIGEDIIFITTKEKMAQILAAEEAAVKLEQELKENSDIAIREKKRPKTYLETIELSQLNISTIVIGEKDRWAIVKDNRGEGHVIKEGTPIGKNSGVVLEIKKGEVIIREEYTDSSGNARHRDINKKVSAPTVDKLKTQQKLEQLENNIMTLKAKIEETESQILHYQKMVEDTPLRETELVKLNSEYNRLSEMYSSLKNRKSEAEMAVSWERKRLQTDDKQGTSEEKEKNEEPASGTLTFLTNELNTVEKQLKEKEEELKKYKERYMGGLPEQLQTNLTILEGLQKQLDQLNSQLSNAENRKLGILRDIDTSKDADDLPALKRHLSVLQTRYSSNHPDVIRLKEIIARLESTN